jgi:hypothetical protein
MYRAQCVEQVQCIGSIDMACPRIRQSFVKTVVGNRWFSNLFRVQEFLWGPTEA